MQESDKQPQQYLHHATELAERFLPPEERSWMVPKLQPSILNSLNIIGISFPDLEPLTAALEKQEILISLDIYAHQVPRNIQHLIRRALTDMPDLPDTISSEPLLTDDDFKLIRHDDSNRFVGELDKIYTYHRDTYPQFSKIYTHNAHLSWLEYNFAAAEDKQCSASVLHGYSTLIQEYIARYLLPSINDAIDAHAPVNEFVLLETRSAYREMAHLSPTTFAESFPIRTALEQFVRSQEFVDKNTHKAVEVTFSGDDCDPIVYMDPGDLYRMTRNLLRDAVTHGEGQCITPVIHIETDGRIVEYSIYSPGQLDAQTLSIIGRKPYTTQDRGYTPHGYGKVGARRLLVSLWDTLGASAREIEQIMKDHWTNTTVNGEPFVRWKAPLPAAVG
jgi:hypothetical protein